MSVVVIDGIDLCCVWTGVGICLWRELARIVSYVVWWNKLMCFMFQNSSWTCDFLFLPLGSLDQFHMPHKLVLFLILNQPCSFLLSFPKISQVNQSKTTPRLIGVNIYPVPFQFNRAHLLRLTGGLKNSLVNFSKINWKATSFAVCLHIAESSGWFSAWQEALFFFFFF